MEKLLKYGIGLAKDAGVEFIELMGTSVEETKLRIENGTLWTGSGNSQGFSIRVLTGGRWGFASCPANGKTTMKELVKTAQSVAAFTPGPLRPVILSPAEPVQDHWESSCKIDPFTVSSGELLELLAEVDAAMALEGIVGRRAKLSFRREHRLYLNSEGTTLSQTKTLSGGGALAWALADNDYVQRSWPAPGGSISGQGYEFIQELDLIGNARRLAREVLALQNAPPCPTGITDVVLKGSMLATQVHNTLGCRALLEGPGSISPELAGTQRLGSPHLNLIADANLPGGAGSLGYDWEGTKGKTFPVVHKGKFAEFFSGRGGAAAIGRSSTGSMRSPSWHYPPTPWPTNLVIHPGSGSLQNLVEGIENGVLLDTVSTFAPGPGFQDFVAKAETGWLIELGQIRHLVKNPVYRGYPTAFWSGCDAVAGLQEQEYLGFMDGGIPVGYMVTPVRIRGVRVGARL